MSKNFGFTLIEVLVVVAILAVLAVIPIANFVFLQKKNTLENSAQEFIGATKNAQNKTLASEQGGQYGVYLNTLVSPHQYILFKGASYALRDVLYDQVNILPATIEFYNISLGGSNEIVFNKITGITTGQGSVSLRLKDDASQNKTVYISNFGVVSLSSLQAPLDDNRVKDSRHIVFDYSRAIDINNENILLTFDGSVVQQIPISQYSATGQIDWQGDVVVGGSTQTIYIHTYRLNNPDTQFSITRDRRYNTKSLVVTISGDSSGNLAQYSADGSATSYSSIYVSNFTLK